MNEYNARDIIKKFLKQQNTTLVQVVNLINANHPDQQTTAPNLTNKLARNTIRFSEVMEIADVLGYKISFQKIDAPEQAPTQQESKPIFDNLKTETEKPFPTKEEQAVAIINRINTPFTVISGIYFPEILIIGENCYIAGENINLAISNNTEKGMSQKGMLFEVLLCAYFGNVFDVIVYPCGYKEIEEGKED